MKLDELKPAQKNRKATRVGRGVGSGLGKTSGRGQKQAGGIQNRWNSGQWNAGTTDGGCMVFAVSAVSDYGASGQGGAGNFEWKSSSAV